MNGKRWLTNGLAVCAVGTAIGAAQPASAQSAACVNLLVGAGYAAWMGVHFGNDYIWSDSFPIGQHRCIKLPVPGMVDNAPYTVVVSAVLGSSKVACTPSPAPWQSGDTNTVTYNASGSVRNVHCEMPSLVQGMMKEGNEPPAAKK